MTKFIEKNKFLLILAVALFLIPLANNSIIVSASEVAPIELIEEDNSSIQNPVSGDEVLPEVSMDKAVNHLEDKAFDVVKLLQVVGKPFCVIVFVVCAILTLIGTFGKSGFVLKGIIGMFISAISYTCIIFAPQIINFFSSWLSS